MTWTTFHRRGETLRTVLDLIDLRRDGLLPMEADGVRETFGDELSLLGALQLRWHARLSGHLERALMHQPTDTEAAVVAAWRAAADELPGVRLVLDHYRSEPLDEQMAATVATSAAKEHALLAAMAGRAGTTRGAAEQAGEEIAERARSGVVLV